MLMILPFKRIYAGCGDYGSRASFELPEPVTTYETPMPKRWERSERPYSQRTAIWL